MDTARSWIIRVNDPGFEAWDAFTHWLEADPVHLHAYEAALGEDDWAAEALRQADNPAPAVTDPVTPVEYEPDEQPPRTGGIFAFTRKQPVWGGAIAASLAAVVAWSSFPGGPQLTEIATEPGEHRSIALGDGSRMEINGNSLVTYHPEDPRRVTLARGEALFEIAHDAANPFIVTVGETRLIDAGTIFNVVHDANTLEVAVAEGVVIYDHGDEEVRLEPGDRLLRGAPGTAVEVVSAASGTIGSWREGLLHYENAPLTDIARDLSRAVGKPVQVSGDARTVRYTGTLATGGSERQLLDSASALLGVSITQTDDNWEMRLGNGPLR